ncbi:hypothetical protein HMPREF0063_11407 [Aeromicrobium marinum DSM 15272]|uniref:DinB-like domain-containing protein n=1 Tax=Aeromicrobium marinum DSM 15272 TaxID=585531 RepID=E2SBJ8_9ACTN|nr:DinB family protein [Aeromicrobium marinum]EFQ83744.1 hypothetical protein HMPREF0063_11407 [Aeromicrobium marinum DSM 15272]
MTITPDTKDWTWVLREACPECGFTAAAAPPQDVADRIRQHPARWARVLGRADAAVRPSRGVWSPTEYAAHVRDMYRVFDERLRLVQEVDDPEFADWDQDEAAIAGDYASLVPEDVADDLATAIGRIAATLDAVPGQGWVRPCRRSNGSVFTAGSLAQYMLHDDVHHLHDVAG